MELVRSLIWLHFFLEDSGLHFERGDCDPVWKSVFFLSKSTGQPFNYYIEGVREIIEFRLGHLPKQCFPGGYLFLSNLMEDALLLMSLAQICHGVEQNFHPVHNKDNHCSKILCPQPIVLLTCHGKVAIILLASRESTKGRLHFNMPLLSTNWTAPLTTNRTMLGFHGWVC
jgi:hypothetical protein